MPLHSYRPKDVVVTFGGVQLSGFGEDSFIMVEPTEATFTMVSGVDGAASRSLTGNATGKVTITLMQTSESNAYLTAIFNADKLTGEGVKSLLIQDNSGKDVHFAPYAFIEQMPSAEYAKEVGTREWSFLCADLDEFLAGSEPAA